MARLEDYRFGRFTIDGEEHTCDLIVLRDRVVGVRREGHSLALEGLDEVLDELPGRLGSASAPTASCVPTGGHRRARAARRARRVPAHRCGRAPVRRARRKTPPPPRCT